MRLWLIAIFVGLGVAALGSLTTVSYKWGKSAGAAQQVAKDRAAYNTIIGKIKDEKLDLNDKHAVDCLLHELAGDNSKDDKCSDLRRHFNFSD